jgi:hypothetical protein
MTLIKIDVILKIGKKKSFRRELRKALRKAAVAPAPIVPTVP